MTVSLITVATAGPIRLYDASDLVASAEEKEDVDVEVEDDEDTAAGVHMVFDPSDLVAAVEGRVAASRFSR